MALAATDPVVEMFSDCETFWLVAVDAVPETPLNVALAAIDSAADTPLRVALAAVDLLVDTVVVSVSTPDVAELAAKPPDVLTD